MLGELNPCGGGDAIPLLKNKLLVGRRSSCDISLRFPNVSSHHCELELVNGYWFVRDLGSRNGIKVNGMRCDSKWLMPGDVLSVARHRYEVTYAPQGDAPPVHGLADLVRRPALHGEGNQGDTQVRVLRADDSDPGKLFQSPQEARGKAARVSVDRIPIQ